MEPLELGSTGYAEQTDEDYPLDPSISHERPFAPRQRLWVLVALGVSTFALLVTTIGLAVALDTSSCSLLPNDKCGGQSCGCEGAAASTNEHATRVGLAVLKKGTRARYEAQCSIAVGGNAFDAAAAIQFALNVVQPQSTGIGGGCFGMLYHAKSNTVYALDGREEAPEAFHSNMFCKDPACVHNESCSCVTGAWPFDDRVTGGNPVGVPGVVAAMQRMLDDFGSWPLKETVQPAVEVHHSCANLIQLSQIQLARDGFSMYPHLNDRITRNRERLMLFPASAALFLPLSDARPVPVGETFSNPLLASTLVIQFPGTRLRNDTVQEELGEKGASWFYEGTLAQEIVDAVKAGTNPVTQLPGVMELSDLKRYRAVYRQPINSTYRKYRIFGMPPPSAGGLALAQMLHYLELFDLEHLKAGEFWHRVLDAQDLAFADRNVFYADADWEDVPFGVLDRNYTLHRALKLLRPFMSAGAPVEAGTPPGMSEWQDVIGQGAAHDKRGTTHFVVVDSERNFVSMTTTIEENLGSAVVVPNRGFLLNNELTDFTVTARDDNGRLFANRPAGGSRPRRTALGADGVSLGGKRPLSSMTPSLVFPLNGDAPLFALGSPGGARITGGVELRAVLIGTKGTVLSVLLQVLDHQLQPSLATEAARIVSRNDFALAENHTETSTVSLLRERGFDVRPYLVQRPLGFVQSVFVNSSRAGKCGGRGWLEAAADVTRLETALALAM